MTKQACVETAHRCVDASSMTCMKTPVGEDVGDLVFVYLIPAAKGVVDSAHHLNPCVCLCECISVNVSVFVFVCMHLCACVCVRGLGWKWKLEAHTHCP